MPDTISFHSNTLGGGSLRVTPLDRDSLQAELAGPTLNASVRVWVLSQLDLLSYLEDLAHHWDGWEGSKVWEAPERQMALECTRDAFGHIFLRVTLREEPAGGRWLASGTIDLAAGELEGLAKSARRILTVPLPVHAV